LWFERSRAFKDQAVRQISFIYLCISLKHPSHFMKRAEIYFDLKPRVASLIWYSSTDVLTDAVLEPLFWLEDEVNAMTVGNNTSFQDICKRAYPDEGAPCLRFSVLDYWHHDQGSTRLLSSWELPTASIRKSQYFN